MILILFICFLYVIYESFILVISPELINNLLGILTGGGYKILIYSLRQYYYIGKINLKDIRNILVKYFVLSHIKWLIYIVCIPLFYSYIENFAFFVFIWFPDILVFLFYLVNIFKLNTKLFYDIPDLTVSLRMQLAVITYDITYGFRRLNNLSLQFDSQFEKASLSRSVEDIALARSYKNQISILRESLLTKIEERRSLAERACIHYNSSRLRSFANMDPQHESILSITYTYIHVDKWDI